MVVLWFLRFCRFLCPRPVRDPFVVLVAGMRRPGAEDVRRAVRKSSLKKGKTGADGEAPAGPSAPKRLCIGEAAPPVPKKPRTDKGVPGPSGRSVPDALGERDGASQAEGVVDLATSSVLPSEAGQGAPARHPAVTQPGPPRPSKPGPSRPPGPGPSRPSVPEPSQPSSSAQIPPEAMGRDLTEAESLGEVSAFGDSAAAISLFQNILLPVDVAEMSGHPPSEIADSVFPALYWVSLPTRSFLIGISDCFLMVTFLVAACPRRADFEGDTGETGAPVFGHGEGGHQGGVG